MRCYHCGAENPDHYSYCHRCGQPVAAPPSSLRPSPGAGSPTSSKTLWIVLGLGVLFILLVALGGTGFWLYKSWKNKQTEEYSQKAGGAEEAEEDQPASTPRKSSGSQRISDAQYYEDRRQWDQAMAEYRLALQENPNDYEAHYGLGNCYRKKRDRQGALKEYQEAIRLNPQYIPARRALARLYARQGNLNAAIEQLEAAKKADPKDPEVAKELANYRKRRANKGG